MDPWGEHAARFIDTCLLLLNRIGPIGVEFEVDEDFTTENRGAQLKGGIIPALADPAVVLAFN